MTRHMFESLEVRRMLFGAGMIGDTLFLQGSNGPDVVSISDYGSQIEVTETFSSYHQVFAAAGVASILVTVGAGSDEVIIPQSSTRPISAFLGSDNDIALIGSGANVHGNITFHGEDGADIFQIFDNNNTTPKTYQLEDGAYGASDMGGNKVFFDNIENVQLINARGNDTVNVIGVTSYATYQVQSEGGTDTINIGNGDTDTIGGGVALQTNLGTMSVNVDDSAGSAARTIGVNTNNVTGIAPGTINWASANITSVALRGPNFANLWTVNNTPVAPTTLFGGTGTETFNVLRTTGPLTINGVNGFDHVVVGNDLQQIAGALTIASNGTAVADLTLNDSLDATPRNIAVVEPTPGTDMINGLAPAAITVSGTQHVYLTTGAASDVTTIFQNQGQFHLDSAGGIDTVNVGDGDDPLFNVLSGQIFIANSTSGARTTMFVHDEGDTQSRDVSIVPSAFNTGYVDIYGIAYYNFSFRPDQVSSVQINGSAGASTYAITGTANGATPMTINAGSNADTFTVTGTNGALRLNGGNGADTFTINGNAAAYPVNIDSGGGNDIVNVNTDNTGSASALFIESVVRLGELHIGNGGRATMLPNGNHLLYLLGALDINSVNGVLDLTDNDMLHDTGLGSYAQDQAMINSGRNGGAWNGAGITSSAAGANPKHNTTLGAMSGLDYGKIFNTLGAGIGGGGAKSGGSLNGTLDFVFDGQLVNSSASVVKYTYYGDTDFNGTVNFDDYSRIDHGFNQHLTGWLNGDFNNNGTINFDDYAYIDLAFNTQSGTL